MGSVVELGHVTHRKILLGLLERLAPDGRVQLWRFGPRHAACVEDVARVSENLVETWWTAAKVSGADEFYVVLLMQGGRPRQWLLLAPAEEPPRDMLAEAQREHAWAAVRVAGIGTEMGRGQRKKDT